LGMLNTRNLRDTMCPLHYGFVLHMVPHKSSVKKRDHIRVRYAAVYTYCPPRMRRDISCIKN
jgi:hypothetical protein